MNIKLQVIEKMRQYQILLSRLSYAHDKNYSSLHGQGLVLNILINQSQIDRAELGERMNMSRNAVAELLRKMEANGLVTRERSSTDKRRSVIKLTDAGKQAAELNVLDKSILPTTLDALNGEELNTLNDYLIRLLDYNNNRLELNKLSNDMTIKIEGSVMPPICDECPGPDQCKRDYLKYGHDRPNPEYCKYADQFPF